MVARAADTWHASDAAIDAPKTRVDAAASRSTSASLSTKVVWGVARLGPLLRPASTIVAVFS